MKPIALSRTLAGLLIAITAWTLISCSPKQAPEVQLRALMDNVERAVEKRELGPLRRLISERYSDEQGNNKKQIVGLVHLYLIGHQKIHLLTQITDINIVDDNRSELTLFVAMSGNPISGAQDLIDIRARLMRFDISWVIEGDDWKVKSVVWRRAQIDDFL